MQAMGKLAVTLLALAAALGPTWIYLVVSNLLEPQGFWQKLLLMGVGVYFLGGLQILLFIGWLCLTAVLWLDD